MARDYRDESFCRLEGCRYHHRTLYKKGFNQTWLGAMVTKATEVIHKRELSHASRHLYFVLGDSMIRSLSISSSVIDTHTKLDPHHSLHECNLRASVIIDH